MEKLLPLADKDGLVEVIAMFKEIICSPIPKPKASTSTATNQPDEDSTELEDSSKSVTTEADGKRQWAADQLLGLVRSGKSVKHEKWINEVIELLVLVGHFDVIEGSPSVGLKVPEPAISETSKSMFRGRLFSILGHLIGLKEADLKSADDSKEVRDRDTWGYRAVKRIKELEKLKEVNLVMEFDGEIEKAVSKGWKRLDKIKKKVRYFSIYIPFPRLVILTRL